MNSIFYTSISLILIVLVVSCRPPLIESAVVDYQHGLYEESLEALKKAVVRYPDNETAWFYLGMNYAKLGNTEEMNIAFEKCISLSPKYIEEIQAVREELEIQ